MVPTFGDEPGYSLDMMRRRRDTPNGLMEWMVAMTAIELRERGCARFSLNFAAFAALFASGTKLTIGQRIEAAFMKRISPLFKMESLGAFNAKFGPAWFPRYIYFEAPMSIPRIGLAYLEAEAFFRLPRYNSPGWRRRGDAPRLAPVPRAP
jgi:lysyl-tRNA synthetase class 2